MPKVQEFTSKIALGTVQFGLDYGVSNKSGKTPEKEVREILSECNRTGIKTFDTASAYGESEAVLGKCLSETVDAQIITKLPAGYATLGHLTSDCLTESLQRLNLKKIYGLLLHSEEDLHGKYADVAWSELVELKKTGQVKKIGASFYTPEKLLSALRRFDLDIIQVPYNLLDHRFFTAELIALYKEKSIEVHTRSVFLQGAFFLDAEKLPKQMARFKLSLQSLSHISANHKFPLHLMSLADALFNKSISKIVLGFSSANELREILRAEISEFSNDAQAEVAQVIKTMDSKLIDPRLWNEG